MAKKKKRKMPTERAMQFIRARGGYVDKCERWQNAPHLPGGGVRKDLFGIIDLIELREIGPDQWQMVGIQCSGETNIAAHVTKIENNEFAVPWLLSGALIEVWAFKKRIVGKQNRYDLVVRPITLPETEPADGKVIPVTFFDESTPTKPKTHATN